MLIQPKDEFIWYQRVNQWYHQQIRVINEQWTLLLASSFLEFLIVLFQSLLYTKRTDVIGITGIRVFVFSPQITFSISWWLIEYGTSIPRTVLGMHCMLVPALSWSRFLLMETPRKISNYLSCMFQMLEQGLRWWLIRLLFRTSRWRILSLWRSLLVRTRILYVLCPRVYPSFVADR